MPGGRLPAKGAADLCAAYGLASAVQPFGDAEAASRARMQGSNQRHLAGPLLGADMLWIGLYVTDYATVVLKSGATTRSGWQVQSPQPRGTPP